MSWLVPASVEDEAVSKFPNLSPQVPLHFISPWAPACSCGPPLGPAQPLTGLPAFLFPSLSVGKSELSLNSTFRSYCHLLKSFCDRPVYVEETPVDSCSQGPCGKWKSALVAPHPSPLPSSPLQSVSQPLVLPFLPLLLGTFSPGWHNSFCPVI